jgi:glycosyltransferase involved in cell wall biosynthesis
VNTDKNNSNPLVTVLICTYNRPQYLPEALNSIFAQTCSDFEIILTRDGGLPVREVVAGFLSDPRLIFVDRDENYGKAYSLNRAMERARGTYIAYLDDDDVWYPHHLSTLTGALMNNPQFGVAYSDLYKAHCRCLPDGRRQVLAKNVEISRDFDRMMLLQFNHALHVSVMHRRDLLNKAGGYNEQLNVLIDWDLTRRLCFYSDFLHVPVVTGQYYAAVGQSDRISVQRRKNVSDYLRNLLTIRATRPPKPWPCMKDLAVLVMASRGDETLEQTLQALWSQSFYPRMHYVLLPEGEISRFRTGIPDIVPVPVSDAASEGAWMDTVLDRLSAEYVAVIPAGLRPEHDEIAFLERSLYPLLTGGSGVAYELVESTPDLWGAVVSRQELLQARRISPSSDVRQSLIKAGIELKKPEFSQYPFQFDNFLTAAAQVEQSGDWDRAAAIYDVLAQDHGNTLWMRTMQANALYQAGRFDQAAALAAELNAAHPTAARLLIEARSHRKQKAYAKAVECYRRAEAILEDNARGREQNNNGPSWGGFVSAALKPAGPQETREWTH